MDHMNNTTSINIYICIPNYLFKKVNVPKKASIKLLLTFFNEDSSDYYFIHNGNFVNPDSSFEQINILNNECLIAMKKKDNDANFNVNLSLRLKKLQNDQNYENKIKILTNQNVEREYNRISDIRFMKIEGNQKLFKKKTRSFLERKESQIDNQDEFDLNINYQPLVEPSQEEMPILW